jgi:hypothetical protein
MKGLVLGNQAQDDLLSFNTSFSYEVLRAADEFLAEYERVPAWPSKFDLLLGFT